jgi:hypothetical protein
MDDCCHYYCLEGLKEGCRRIEKHHRKKLVRLLRHAGWGKITSGVSRACLLFATKTRSLDRFPLPSIRLEEFFVSWVSAQR